MTMSLKQVNDMPPGFYTVKTRMKDATKVAKEVVLSLRPIKLEEELRITDQRYAKIACLTIQRIRYLLETKDHFLHNAREEGKFRRKQARDKKSQLFLDIGNSTAAPGTNKMPKAKGCSTNNARRGSQSIASMLIC